MVEASVSEGSKELQTHLLAQLLKPRSLGHTRTQLHQVLMLLPQWIFLDKSSLLYWSLAHNFCNVLVVRWRSRQDIRGVLFIIEVTEVLVWPGKEEVALIFHLVKSLVTINR